MRGLPRRTMSQKLAMPGTQIGVTATSKPDAPSLHGVFVALSPPVVVARSYAELATYALFILLSAALVVLTAILV